MIAGSQNWSTRIQAVTPPYLSLENWTIAQGASFTKFLGAAGKAALGFAGAAAAAAGTAWQLGREAEEWPKKLKYFQYALEKHAVPRPPIDDDVWAFYQKLQDWVRRECGAEAIRQSWSFW